MTYRYIDYTPADEELVDSWIDNDAEYYNGLEDGFGVYYRCWENEPHTIFGENFWIKIVCRADEPIGVVVLCLSQDTIDFAQIFLAPAERGKGIGTAVVQDVLKHDKEIIGTEITTAEACIFPSNTASQKMFEKAGFRFDRAHEDGDIWYYTYTR